MTYLKVNALLLTEMNQWKIREMWMKFTLVDGWSRFGRMQQFFQMLYCVVGYSD